MRNSVSDGASPPFERTKTIVTMPRLVGTHPIDVLPRFLHFFLVPFWVSLVLSIVSEFIPKHWQSIVVDAVSGQMALTLMKLFWYIAILLLSIAAAVKSLPKVGKNLACPFRWAGSKLAEVVFDYTSGAVGVISGIAPAVICEHHLQGLSQIGYILFIMMLAQFLMWGLTNLAASNFDRYVPKPAAIIGLGSLAFACIAVYSFYKEPWTETQKDHMPIHAAAVSPPSDKH